MPILQNIFKKASKKEPTSPQSRQKSNKQEGPPQVPEKQRPLKQEQKREKQAKGVSTGSGLLLERAHGAYGVIVRPHISEKSVRQNDQDKYAFEIYSGVTAPQVKRAIERTYGVNVENVHISKVPSKPTRYRRNLGSKSRYDKAVVTLKEGQNIEVLPQ